MERDDSLFLAALTQANQEIGRYVMRMLEADSGRGRTEYTRDLGEIEQVLGTALLRLGRQLVERAEARGLVVVESLGARQEADEVEVSETSRGKPDVRNFQGRVSW